MKEGHVHQTSEEKSGDNDIRVLFTIFFTGNSEDMIVRCLPHIPKDV